jgi:hypothetical protein
MFFAARHMRGHRVGCITTTMSVNSATAAASMHFVIRVRYHVAHSTVVPKTSVVVRVQACIRQGSTPVIATSMHESSSSILHIVFSPRIPYKVLGCIHSKLRNPSRFSNATALTMDSGNATTSPYFPSFHPWR